jgi:site-specific DNA-methyltransferase (adenine-specific)
MPIIPDGSIDMILCDLPYNMTKNHWDIIIPLDKLWQQYNRIIKENGAIVLFGQDKFSAKLMLSNEKMHKYNLIWKKGERTSGFLNAKKQPLRNHEDILIFYKKQPVYNPQFILGEKSHSRGTKGKLVNNNYGKYDFMEGETKNGEWKYPKSILNFDRPHPPIHPTQKPVELCEWLIRTYTNENEIVLDNSVGIGTTCIAAKNTNRKYIGIELNKEYYNKALELLDIKKEENIDEFWSS